MKNNLEPMPQYHIERNKLCEIVEKTVGYERLMNAFCYGHYIYVGEFAWFRNGDEFYIIHLDSGMMVNWYKHLDGTNTCSQYERTIEDYYEFFNKFKDELDHLKR